MQIKICKFVRSFQFINSNAKSAKKACTPFDKNKKKPLLSKHYRMQHFCMRTVLNAPLFFSLTK
jgi:hypothetical protein